MGFSVLNEASALIIVLFAIAVASGKPTECVSGDVETSLGCSKRFDNDQGENSYESMPLCKSKKRFINPDDLINPKSLDDKWQFDKNFNQTLEVEVCENEGSSCTDDIMVKSKCKQKYLAIQLQVVSKDSTRSEVKTFSIPSNCECVYYKPSLRIRSNKN